MEPWLLGGQVFECHSGPLVKISRYTVHDNLKSIFDKTGVGSRPPPRPRCWNECFVRTKVMLQLAERYTYRMDVVGREREIGDIRDLLDRTADGSGGLLVFTGPRGAGKTTVAECAIDEARRRSIDVVRISPAHGAPGRLVWAQVLRDIGASDEAAADLLNAQPVALDGAAQLVASSVRRVVVIDDIDVGGPEAIELLAIVASRIASSSTAVVATATSSLGVGREHRLRGLSEEDLIILFPELRADARHAVWMATAGRPGAARELAETVAGLSETDDPVVHLALNAPSVSTFLDVDIELVHLLEDALARSHGELRARVLARLARELLGDASSDHRRRELMDESLETARQVGDERVLAEVLDARLHALWDPAGAEDRLATASEIIEHARTSGDGVRERQGMFWRFVALMELARVPEAEAALVAFERASERAGDDEAIVMAIARHAMLATLRGHFDDAERLAADVATRGHRAGVADTDRLCAAVRGPVVAERGPPEVAAASVDVLRALSRQMPGHFYEATAARLLLALGRDDEASTELERIFPRVASGSGPRWLGAVADLSLVAAATANERAVADLYDLLLPYEGQLVVWAGANTTVGPASRYLGVLATARGLHDEAVAHLGLAITLEEDIGALPGLAHSLVALGAALSSRAGQGDAERASDAIGQARSIAERLGMSVLLESLDRPDDVWVLTRDGTDWILDAGDEHARLRDGRGLHYLRALVAMPGREITALDLAGGGSGVAASKDEPVLDDAGRAAYRRRLSELDVELDAADRVGDSAHAEHLEAERTAIVAEVRHASGLGGRPRAISNDAERARINVTRTLRTAIERIGEAAPRCAAHLEGSIRTGRACRYEPGAGGPSRWQV